VTACCLNLDVRVGGEKIVTTTEKGTLIFLLIDWQCISQIKVKVTTKFFEVLMYVETY